MYCTAFGAVITTGFCIWAVQTYGFYGAPLGGVVGSWINLVLLILYCLFSGCHRKCWGGWSGDAFRAATWPAGPARSFSSFRQEFKKETVAERCPSARASRAAEAMAS